MKKLKIQKIIEKLICQHGLYEQFYNKDNRFISMDFYMKNYDMLHIEKNGRFVAVGHYYESSIFNDDRTITKVKKPDPILKFILMDSQLWFPLKVELVLGTTQCTSFEKVEGMYICCYNKEKIDDFIYFSNIFANNIYEQNWSEAELLCLSKVQKEDVVNGYRSF